MHEIAICESQCDKSDTWSMNDLHCRTNIPWSCRLLTITDGGDVDRQDPLQILRFLSENTLKTFCADAPKPFNPQGF